MQGALEMRQILAGYSLKERSEGISREDARLLQPSPCHSVIVIIWPPLIWFCAM